MPVCERAGEYEVSGGAEQPRPDQGPLSGGLYHGAPLPRYSVRCPPLPPPPPPAALSLSTFLSPSEISCFSLVSRRPPQAGATLAAKTAGCYMLLQVSSAVTAHRPPTPPPPSARPRQPTATRQPQRCCLTQPSAFRSVSLFSIFRPPALSCLPLSVNPHHPPPPAPLADSRRVLAAAGEPRTWMRQDAHVHPQVRDARSPMQEKGCSGAAPTLEGEGGRGSHLTKTILF